MLDNPTVFIMVSSGIPDSLAFDAAAAFVLCGLYVKSMPAFSNTIFTQREIVSLETRP